MSESSDKTTLDPTVILLSPRAWLAQWPRLLQLFVVALLLLASVAQSWHVCALGGHGLGSEHSSHGAGQVGHGAKHFKVIYNADGTPGPVICQCAHEDGPNVNAFAALPPAHEHMTCLALLLQTMPLQAGVPFSIELREVARPLYARRAQITPAFAIPLARRGRAPPLDC